MTVMQYHSVGFGCFLLSAMCCVDVAEMFGMAIGIVNCLAGVGVSPNYL